MSTSSFPIDFHALVALTAVSTWSSQGVPGTKSHEEASFDLIEAALEAKVVDYDQVLEKSGHGAVFLWDTKLDGIPGPLLEKMGRQHPTLGPVVDGLLPFQAVLHSELATNSYRAKDTLLRWVRFAPLSALGIKDPNAGAVFFSLITRLLTSQSGRFDMDNCTELLTALEHRGVNWKAPLQALAPFASVNLSEAMILSGLDVMEAVRVNDQDLPLWQAWSQAKNPALDQMMVKHQAVSGEGSKSLEIQKYFSHFGTFQSTRAADLKLRQKLWDHLVSKDNWHQMCDENGKSALFHAIQVDPGVLRPVLDQLKDPKREQGALEALTHHDHRGRGLWFYLLPKAQDNTITEKLVGQLEEVVGSQVALSGKGWRLVALEDFKSAQQAWTLPGKEAPSSFSFSLRKAGFDDKILYGRSIYASGWVSPNGDDDIKEAIREALKFIRSSKGILESLDKEWASAAKLWQDIATGSGYQWESRHTMPLKEQVERLADSIQYFPLPVPLFQKQLATLLKGFGSKHSKEESIAKAACQIFEQMAKRTTMFENLPQATDQAAPRRPRM